MKLLFLLSHINKFEEHSYRDSYIGELSCYSSPKKSEYELNKRFTSYSNELLEKGNKSNDMCFKLDLLLFNWNFITKSLTSTNIKGRSVYEIYVHFCSSNTFFIQKYKDMHNSQLKLVNHHFCDSCEFSLGKISLIRISLLTHP